MPVTFPHAYLFKPVDPATVREKKRRGRCVCHGCKRRAETAARHDKCPTCRSRLYRLKNDDRYAYTNLRASARKRGIEFLLSFDDFMEFVSITGYLEARGKDPHSLTIDRIKTDRPYQLGNLRIMTYADNISHRYEEFADAARSRRRRVA